MEKDAMAATKVAPKYKSAAEACAAEFPQFAMVTGPGIASDCPKGDGTLTVQDFEPALSTKKQPVRAFAFYKGTFHHTDSGQTFPVRGVGASEIGIYDAKVVDKDGYRAVIIGEQTKKGF